MPDEIDYTDQNDNCSCRPAKCRNIWYLLAAALGIAMIMRMAIGLIELAN